MPQSKKNKRRLGRFSKKLNRFSKKLNRFSKKLKFMRHPNKIFTRGKGIRVFLRSPIPPSPIPPPNPPSPIPPPRAPSPLIPLPYLPTAPPPNPIEDRPRRMKKRWRRNVSFAENVKK